MGKREKNPKSAKTHRESEEENEELQLKPTKSPIAVGCSSDDDEVANEDLSLKIVEKAMLRACNAQPSHAVSAINLCSSSSEEEAEVVVQDVKSKKKGRREKNKKNKEVENPVETVVVAKEEERAETSTATEGNELAETNPTDKSDNAVLRKLLRGPRYFDPPDSGWGACYNCGEEGHITVNCTAPRRKKPCFVCGSLEHNAKQCTKGQDCFICKKGGHRAKDCPEKYKRVSQNSKICLKCGDSGHDMFTCKNDYYLDDLKEIQCYICKSFGHLCCADFTDTGPGELSCYRCGQLGHNGLECNRSGSERASAGSPSACFRCGEEGHFARECTTKVTKRNHELSTPTKKFSEKNRDYARARSLPSDVGKTRKRSKPQHEGVTAPPSNLKRRGGWIPEDPDDLSPGNANIKWRGGWIPEDPEDLSHGKANVKRRGGWIAEDPGDLSLSHGKAQNRGWGSPVTPTNKRYNPYSPSTGGHASTSRSPRNMPRPHFGASPASNGSSRFYQPRYPASRFGNFSNDGMRRNYDW